MKSNPKIYCLPSFKSLVPFFNHFRSLLSICVLVFLLSACDKGPKGSEDPICDDPCARPDVCDCSITGPSNGKGVDRESFTTKGTVTETPSGFTVKGELEVDQGETQLNFANADLEVSFNLDGSLNTITGTASIPSPDPCMEFKDPVQFNLGYYKGAYINREFYLGFPLEESMDYFVFRFSVNLEMNVCTNNDPNATKPFVIKAPVGGELLYVADYTDPFFYFSAAHDQLGKMGMGSSFEGKIEYKPLQPIAGLPSFSGNSVRTGSISFPALKVLEAEDVVFIRNVAFNGELLADDPMGSKLGADFQAGLNGKMKLALSVASFVTFEIPMAEASAAISVRADNQSGLQAYAFVNGLLAPDLSWWPSFLPIKPTGQMRTSGFIQQNGKFNISLEGDIGIEVPGKTIAAAGEITASKDTFRMAGSVKNGSDNWGAEALFLKDETRMTAIPPSNLLAGLSGLIEGKIDAGYDEIVAARQRLTSALENYEIELSLRGLRDDLPDIVRIAKAEIEKGKKAGKDRAKAEVNSALGNKYKLCTTSIYSTIYKDIDKYAQPYIDVLDRLKAAVDETKDDAQTRRELANALRALASKDKLSFDESYTVKATLKGFPCAVGSSRTQRVKFTRTVINSSQVNLLLKAADYVKFIQPASDRVFQARRIISELPTEEDLAKIRDALKDQADIVNNIGGAGYIKNHNTGKYTYFLIIGGTPQTVDELNPFDMDGIGDGVMGFLKDD